MCVRHMSVCPCVRYAWRCGIQYNVYIQGTQWCVYMREICKEREREDEGNAYTVLCWANLLRIFLTVKVDVPRVTASQLAARARRAVPIAKETHNLLHRRADSE